MRLRRPDSLRGQLLLAALLGLAVAQVIGAAITVTTRQQAVRAAMLGDAVDRVEALVYVLERTPADVQGSLLRAVETPLTRLSVDAAPVLAADGPGLARARRRLVAALTDAGEPRDVRMAMTTAAGDAVPPPQWPPQGPRRWQGPPRHHAPPPPSSLAPDALTLSIPLASGDWLNAQVRFPRLERGLPAMSLLTVVLAAAAIGLALWLVLARLLGPLRRLAGAAERLGRGEEVGPLPVSGPSEMRALTEAFNQMRQRLHRMVSDRTQMLAALGHDLRSPLTALRLRAEMVEEDETRERLMVSLDEMQEMVEQTLTYARGVWTAEGVEDVDAGAMLRDLAGEAGGLPLHLPPAPVLLRLRPATIRRALRNLIDNARRYGTGVEIALHPRPDSIAIEIADRGPGIPPEELARVFDPFVRLEASRSRETGGAGLGLSIARSIVQAHGGEVTLANRAGGGLVATVTLPRPAGG